VNDFNVRHQPRNNNKRYEIGCQLLLITNRKSHMGFWLIPTLMTLCGIIPLFCIFFTEFDCFAGQLYHRGWRQTYNVRKILSRSYSLPLLAITNPPCSGAVSLRQLSYLLTRFSTLISFLLPSISWSSSIFISKGQRLWINAPLPSSSYCALPLSCSLAMLF